jgi:hypothetical protein
LQRRFVSLSIRRPAGRSLAALQWEISFPSALAVDLSGIVAGSAAQSAGKSITCAKSFGGISRPLGSRFKCILAGGSKTIGNGPIAIVYFRFQSDVKGAPVRVAIDHVTGVTPDLKPIAISDLDAIITPYRK